MGMLGTEMTDTLANKKNTVNHQIIGALKRIIVLKTKLNLYTEEQNLLEDMDRFSIGHNVAEKEEKSRQERWLLHLDW